jgi:hypothetical protein
MKLARVRLTEAGRPSKPSDQALVRESRGLGDQPSELHLTSVESTDSPSIEGDLLQQKQTEQPRNYRHV